MTNEQILVTNPVPDADPSTEDEWRSLATRKGLLTKAISLSQLEANLQNLVRDLRNTIAKLDSSADDYELQEIEVAVAITLSGEVSILGTGGSVGTETGLKLLFKKRVAKPKSRGGGQRSGMAKHRRR